jgi:outer membrane protein OmpA-like peptidoglycan-associated protein
MFHLSTTRRPPLARETQPDHEIGGDRDGPPRRGPITPFSARVETVLGLQRTAGNRAFAGTLSESGPSDLGQPGVGSADGYLPGERGFADISGRGRRPTDVTRRVLYSFPVNKPFVKPEHRARLRRLVHDMRLDQPDTITPVAKIVGFGDAVHRRGGTIELRQDRAEAVELFLLSSGALESNIGPLSPPRATTSSPRMRPSRGERATAPWSS